MTYGKDGKDGNLLAESLDARSASWVLMQINFKILKKV